MNKKKLTSIILAGLIAASLSVTAFAEGERVTSNSDATVSSTSDSANLVFTPGLWTLSIDGTDVGNLAFVNETEGYLVRFAGEIRAPFTYIQDGNSVTFYVQTIEGDVATTATINNANEITIDWADLGSVDCTVTFEADVNSDTYINMIDELSNLFADDETETPVETAPADATYEEPPTDAFITDAPDISMLNLEEGDISRRDSSFVIAGDEVVAAAANGDLTLYIKFKSAEPFNIDAHVKTTTGITKIYTMQGSGRNAESYFPVKDMLDALHIDVSEVATIELADTTDCISSFTFNKSVMAGWGKSDGKDGKDDNPATGVGLAVVPALMSCAAVMLSRKRK